MPAPSPQQANAPACVCVGGGVLLNLQPLEQPPLGASWCCGQVQFQGAEITAAGSPENIQKSEPDSSRFSKERGRGSMEVEGNSGEVLISFSNRWREVNEEEISLNQLRYMLAKHWRCLFKRCLSKCAIKHSEWGKTKSFLIRNHCPKYHCKVEKLT